MTKEQGDILGVLLDVKEEKGFSVEDQLVKDCYELQKKHQFDRDRNTVDLTRSLIEESLEGEGE